MTRIARLGVSASIAFRRSSSSARATSNAAQVLRSAILIDYPKLSSFDRIGARLSFSSSTEIVWAAADTVSNPALDKSERLKALQQLQVSTDSSQYNELVDSGAIKGVVSILRGEGTKSSDVDLLIHAFLTIIKTSTSSAVVNELLALEAIDTIASYLQHQDLRLVGASCVALGNIALDPSASSSVSSPSVLDRLVRALQEVSNESVQRGAVTALSTIAGIPHAREYLCESDALQTLFDYLAPGKDDATRATAAFAIGNVLSARDISAQDFVRESGALATLSLLLSPVYSPELTSSAAWAVHHATNLNKESQSLAREAGALRLLLQHAKAADDEELRTNALLALESSLVQHESNLEWWQESEGPAQLEALEREQVRNQVQLTPVADKALRAILNM